MIQTVFFGKTPSGEEVYKHTIENGNTKVVITDFGARVLDITFKGVKCVCGFDTLEGVLRDTEYHGSIAGRYANRISKGKFTLNGKEYTLNLNEKGRCHLHGGNIGFSARVWKAVEKTENSVKLLLISEDGDEGYPGKLTLYVTYTLVNDTLSIDYDAVTDKDTVINLTNHMYFNIGGVGEESILDQTLRMNAYAIGEVDEILIPTGYLMPVKDTPFDFNTPKKIGKDIRKENQQLSFGGGYDHSFVLSNGNPAATIHSDKSGITMTIVTTEPGIQMYTGNYMDEDNPFFGTIKQVRNGAVALECNKLPDSPNHPEFPSCVLKVGEHYIQHTEYKFN